MLHTFVGKIRIGPNTFDAPRTAQIFNQAKYGFRQSHAPESRVKRHSVDNCIRFCCMPAAPNMVIRGLPFKIDTHICRNFISNFYDVPFFSFNIVFDGIDIRIIVRPLDKSLFPLKAFACVYDFITLTQLRWMSCVNVMIS